MERLKQKLSQSVLDKFSMDFLRGQVRRASSLKKRLKDIYARGGDYVAALTGGAAV